MWISEYTYFENRAWENVQIWYCMINRANMEEISYWRLERGEERCGEEDDGWKPEREVNKR